MSRQEGLVRSEPQSLMQSDQRPEVTPACDVYENDEEVLVVADVPGVNTDGLEINLVNGELNIVARRDLAPGEGTLLGMEYRDCDYRRRFAVPGGIDAEKIDAKLEKGVLWLHLPKSQALKPRRIAVRAG